MINNMIVRTIFNTDTTSVANIYTYVFIKVYTNVSTITNMIV